MLKTKCKYAIGYLQSSSLNWTAKLTITKLKLKTVT
jgi:hypothetical protein